MHDPTPNPSPAVSPLPSYLLSALPLQLSCFLFLLSPPSSVLLSPTAFYGDICFFVFFFNN